jgi:hypothetical protein
MDILKNISNQYIKESYKGKKQNNSINLNVIKSR